MPYANRDMEELQGVVGYVVNVLPLRASVAGNPSFRSLLLLVHERVRGAFSHSMLPFQCLVSELGVPRSSAYNPVFQAAFVMQQPRSAGVIVIMQIRALYRFCNEMHVWALLLLPMSI